MSKGTLYDKVWDSHLIGTLPSGKNQILIDRHLIHEVTSPQGFHMLKEKNLRVLFPEHTISTVDHIIPTTSNSFGDDELGQKMYDTLKKNTTDGKIIMFDRKSGKQGIVHVMAPELGYIQPGMMVACGDSHTSTHGGLGAIAFGIGSTQVGHVLATQSLAENRLKVKKIEVNGKLQDGVYSKDVILKIIKELGTSAGQGYAYEFSGKVLEDMSIEERFTVCNMSIEAGAKIGYVNPDLKTVDYLLKTEIISKLSEREKKQLMSHWESVKSNKNAQYDGIFNLNGSNVQPMITWGTNPGEAIGIDEKIPSNSISKSLNYMDLKKGESLLGMPYDIGFIGSCTNSRIEDLRIASEILKGKKINPFKKLVIVPGSEKVFIQAEEEGLDKIFRNAGADYRLPGCSMCLAMNPDKLKGYERCLSTSNRNFEGRQGSPTGRTHLASPALVAASALEGKIADPRRYLK